MSGNLKNTLHHTFYKITYPLFYLKWLQYSSSHNEIKLIVGSGSIGFQDWFATDIQFLNVASENDFARLFKVKKIDKILAEHVLEHLTTEQLQSMAENFYKYSTPQINIRIAVPDGYHKNEEYINQVKPHGTGNGAHDHKHLFNYKSLSEIFEKAGFKATPVEYWDENNEFHTNYKNDDKGTVRRSLINDKRNADGIPHYTSLIIDFTK